MPNIHQYDAGTDIGLRTDDRAASSTANAGRRITALYNTAAEAQGDTGRRIASAITDAGRVAVDFVTNREINRGAAEAATVISTLDQKWNATIKNADPNDPSVAAKFKEDTVEPTLQKLKEGFITEGGQKFAEARVEQFRNHFVTKVASDMATKASIAVRDNINTMTNQLSNMAISDPTSVKASLEMIRSSVKAMVDSSPTLGGVEAARVISEVTHASQTAVVKAAAIGAINANPEAGLKQFSSGEYSKYISGAELKSLEAHAKSVQRAERADVQRQRTLEKQQKQEVSDATENEYLAKIFSGDPRTASQVTTKDVATDPKLTRESRERMIGIVERQTKAETPSRVSQQTFVNLLRDLRAADVDTDAVMKKAWDARLKDPGQPDSLSEKDFNQFRAEVIARKTPEGAALEHDRAAFFKNYGTAIAGTQYTPQIGDPKIYRAEMDARRMEADLRKAGKDPHSLYDPSSPDFIGKPGMLQKWRGSMQGDLTTRAEEPKRNDAMPAIPPAEQRDIGGIYDTPKGKLKWLGGGRWTTDLK